ncbi:F0F1 ATP synthase subunit B' [Paracoccaceae bacterium GXU_MW_L88]
MAGQKADLPQIVLAQAEEAGDAAPQNENAEAVVVDDHGATPVADGDHGGETYTGTGADGYDESGGMPQLDFATWPNQIFWLLIALAALYFILKNFAIPRIGGTIEDRHGVIQHDLDQAADYRRKAEQAEAAYKAALADARTESQKIADEKRAEIQDEIDAEIAKADAEIAAKTSESEARIAEIRDSALENVNTVAKDTAKALIESLGLNISDEDVNTAVQKRVEG